MSKSDYLENGILALILNATPIPNVADNASTAPLTNLYVGLHTADPTDAGDQTSNETNYTGYARVAVARSGAGWVVTGSSVSPANDITFADPTGGSGTITHVTIGEAASGAGNVHYHGALSPPITITPGAGNGPVITTASTITED